MNSSLRIAVIGAGIGGLAAAALLARAGHRIRPGYTAESGRRKFSGFQARRGRGRAHRFFC
jgi:NADPH-dependent glutamate synthase beta subunit-like oxidoreductase